jgi:ABC-type transport system substrate-binding protein
MKEHANFFDPDGARAALAASAYPDPKSLPPITIAVSPTSASRPIVEAISQMWQDVLGISPAVLPQDPGFDAAELGAQAQTWSPFPLYSAPGDDLVWTYRAGNLLFSEGVGKNDDEVEALIEQGEALAPDAVEERGAFYQQAEDMILDRAYFIPLHYYEWWYLVQPNIANIGFNPDTSLNVETTYIAAE